MSKLITCNGPSSVDPICPQPRHRRQPGPAGAAAPERLGLLVRHGAGAEVRAVKQTYQNILNINNTQIHN